MTKVSELVARMGKVELTGTITKKDDPRTFDKFGKPGKVANAKIKDDSGEVTLTLWNDQVDQVNVGDVVAVHNGWVSEYRGELQLSTGKFGTLELTGKGEVPPSAPAAAPEPVAHKPAITQKFEAKPAPKLPSQMPVDEKNDDDTGSTASDDAFEEDFSDE